MTEPVDWYFDVISPFAWLQWQRLQRDHRRGLWRSVVPRLVGRQPERHDENDDEEEGELRLRRVDDVLVAIPG